MTQVVIIILVCSATLLTTSSPTGILPGGSYGHGDTETIKQVPDPSASGEVSRQRRSFYSKFLSTVQYVPGAGHVMAGIQKLNNDHQGAADTFKKVSGVSGAITGGVIGFASSGPAAAASAAAASYSLAGYVADAANDVAGYPTH